MRWVAALALALAACPAPRSAVRPPPRPDSSAAAPARPPSPRPPPLPLAPAEQHDEPALEGVLHTVHRGETVYRIARAYGIEPADLMESNGISDPRSLAVGAELFVPGATGIVEVPAAPVSGDPAPSGAHAAATPAASAADTGPSSHTPVPAPAPAAAPAAAGRGVRDTPLAWPLKGVLYGRYGVRGGRRHDGIDIAAPEGTSVAAAAPGTVIYAGEQTGYGSIVIVRHDAGLVTLYAHNSRLLVEEGARVRRGEAIARVGQTGRTTGPHLHFEVREGTRPRNPLLYLP